MAKVRRVPHFGRGRPSHLTVPPSSTDGSWKFRKTARDLHFKQMTKVANCLGKVPFFQASVVIHPSHISQVYILVSLTPYRIPARASKAKEAETLKVCGSHSTPPLPHFSRRLRVKLKWWSPHAPPPVLQLIHPGMPRNWPLSTSPAVKTLSHVTGRSRRCPPDLKKKKK